MDAVKQRRAREGAAESENNAKYIPKKMDGATWINEGVASAKVRESYSDEPGLKDFVTAAAGTRVREVVGLLVQHRVL